VLSGAFAYADASFDVVLNGATKEITGAFASSEAFRTLGVEAVAGRMFGPADERAGLAEPVVAISYELWNRAFAADPAAIGRTLLIDGKPFSIVGVTPPRFFGLTVGRATDVYVPLNAEPYLRGKESAFPNAIRYWIMVFGRVRPGLTFEQAENRLAAMSPLTMQATLPMELPLRVRPQYLKQRFVLQPAASGVSYVRTNLRLPLAILSALVLLLLLLASFTIANLLLARASSRQKEIAVRIALGASRGRIIRQLAFEGLALAFAGAGAGLVVSRALAVLLVRVSSSASDPLVLDLSLDWAVFGFACVAATLSAILFGFAPAMRAAHIAPADAFKSGSATVSSSVMRMRWVLLTGQVAITVVMTIGAVLFGATLRNLLTVETGFNRNNVLLADLDLRRTRIPKEARASFDTRLLDRIRSLPLIESGSLCYVTPISGSTWQFDVRAESGDGWKAVHTHYNAVTPEFFSTFGTRVLAGRTFSDRDSAGALPVAVVNATFARMAFGSANAIGRRISQLDPEPRTVEIVGIVQDAKYRSLRAVVPPTLYEPFAQYSEPPRSVSVALRSRVPANRLLRGLSTVLSKEFPDLSFQLTTLRAQIDDSVTRERVFALVFALFGGLALCLAATGIYGVLAYFVEQRRPELGIRIALGATPADVRRLIYAQSMSALATGGVFGCLFALWGAKFTRTILYGIKPAQPEAYAAAIGVVVAIAAVATLIPAIRASRAEGVTSLRCE
jgi:predicted permease